RPGPPRRAQPRNTVIVMPRRNALQPGTAPLVPGDHPPHRLVRSAAGHRGATVSAHLAVGRNDVHPFPRRLQWKLPGRSGDWLTPPPSPPGPQPPGRPDERGLGTFNWPKAGTSTWPHVGTFSWPRTPDEQDSLTKGRSTVIGQHVARQEHGARLS